MMSSRHRYRARTDNIIAALQQNDRICELGLWEGHKSSQLEKVAAVVQSHSPVLTSVGVQWHSIEDTTSSHVTGSPPVVPDSFMGGSASPRRPRFHSRDLSKLLSFANGLVHLLLSDILHSGYSSPDALVACLTTAVSKISHSNFQISIASISP